MNEVSRDIRGRQVRKTADFDPHFLLLPLAGAFPFPFPLPNGLPSKPGRPLSFVFTPFRLSFFLSLRIAMLSVRFFCFTVIEAASCSLRSSLHIENL